MEFVRFEVREIHLKSFERPTSNQKMMEAQRNLAVFDRLRSLQGLAFIILKANSSWNLKLKANL